MEDLLIQLDFGKNSAHIWASYAIWALSFALLAWYPAWAKRKVIKQVQTAERRAAMMKAPQHQSTIEPTRSTNNKESK